jgi:D-3-phosphoglycerate dehydrogenase
MLRIVIPDDDPPVMVGSSAFKKLSDYKVQVYQSRPASPSDLAARIGDAEIAINIRASSRFNREVFRISPKLRLISIWGTGTDHVDLEAAKACGIRVTNTPRVSAAAVAEHTLSLLMAVAKQTVSLDSQVREGKWPRGLATQLGGKTLGLIGTGAIGREVARLGKGIGMHVIAWTFHPVGGIAEWVAFEEVFRRSDVVSVHVRQSPQTEGMIRREHFGLMKPAAIFVNTARGAVVREADLIEALASHRIAGAGLDVFEAEPLAPDSAFFSMENVVLSPHSAGITTEATEAGLALAIQNVFDWLAGNAKNVVV